MLPNDRIVKCKHILYEKKHFYSKPVDKTWLEHLPPIFPVPFLSQSNLFVQLRLYFFSDATPETNVKQYISPLLYIIRFYRTAE